MALIDQKVPQDIVDRAIAKARNVFTCPHCGAPKGHQCRNVGLDDIHDVRMPKGIGFADFLTLEANSPKLEQIAPALFAKHLDFVRVPKTITRGDIDFKSASESIRLLDGRIIVEMLPATKRLVLVPESVEGKLRPHLGVVLQSMEYATPRCGTYIYPPEPGTIVIVRRTDGTWIKDAYMGGYQPQNEVRVYGVYGEFRGHPQLYDWWDSVLASYNETMAEWVPFGDKIIFRRDAAFETTDGGVFLLNGMHRRTAEATVVAVGPLEMDVKVGDRVCYDPFHIEQVGIEVEGQVDIDLVIGSQLSINYVIPDKVTILTPTVTFDGKDSTGRGVYTVEGAPLMKQNMVTN